MDKLSTNLSLPLYEFQRKIRIFLSKPIPLSSPHEHTNDSQCDTFR